MVKLKSPQAFIAMHYGNDTAEAEFEVALERRNGSDHSLNSNVPPSIFIAGYGANRATYGKGGLESSIGSLFSQNYLMTDPELALRRIQDFMDNPRIYTNFMTQLKKALNLQEADTINTAKGGGLIIQGPSTHNAPIPYEGWADGYRFTMSWILDLFVQAFSAQALDDQGHIEGILLLDEVEQHLHPSMQLGIMDKLRKLLPKMQIIATTHSPMTALGLEPHEVIVLKEDGEQVTWNMGRIGMDAYSAEELLSDEILFDSDVYAPPIAAKLKRYHHLVGKSQKTCTESERKEMNDLVKELENLGVIAPAPEFKAELAELAKKLGV